ncbi:MAG: HAD family hydrolase [Blautia sp.]|jgi:HAD superfamily hydrolase (TIGR01509 family)
MWLEQKKAVIFDLDGTLVDSMGIWGQIDIDYLGELSLEVPKDLQRVVEGMSFTEVAVYFKERFSIQDSVEEIKAHWLDMAMEKYEKEVPLKPGAASFLKYLKGRGIKTAVASSNSLPLIRAVLSAHDILDDFGCIITSCEVAKGKPAPDVYLEAARRLDTPPSQCLVFEDIIPGILAGKRAGMEVIAVRDDYSLPQEEEKRRLADRYIESYYEILEGMPDCAADGKIPDRANK